MTIGLTGASAPPPVRAGTIVDLHVHTVNGAADSNLHPADLQREARRIGLTGANLSEHDRVWDRTAFERFRAESGLFLSQGMEVSTDLGHILVVGIDRYYQGIRSAQRLREICDEIGAFMCVAHPFRHFFDPVHFLRQGKEPFAMTPAEAAERMPVFGVVHGVEVGNGGNTRRENAFAYEVARILDKPMTGGSDAHSVNGLGIYCTCFDEPLESREQMLALLHAGRAACYGGLNTDAFQPFRPVDGS